MTVREDVAPSESTRRIDEQRATTDTLQARAGVLLAAGAIVNVGLGQLAFGGRQGFPLPVLSGVGAVAAFVGFSLLLALAWPHKIQFAPNPTKILDGEAPYESPDDELIGDLVRAMEIVQRNNEGRLARLTWMLRIAVIVLFVNAAAWGCVALLGGG